MRRALRSLIGTSIAALGTVLALPASGASAAPWPASDDPWPHRQAHVYATSTTGYDVSHPQCGEDLPTGQAFGVVGVNGGLASTPNPCLAEQLTWAWDSTGAVPDQPRVQLYLNTANPGEVRDRVTTWPDSGVTPYGDCDGGNDRACSWEYGWQRARASVTTFFADAAREADVDRDPAHYTWWLDVETVNTWQRDEEGGQARNRAALEGMAAYLDARGAEVGLYAVPSQWREVTGHVPDDSILAELDSWLPGAESLGGAAAGCGREPLVEGGDVVLTQYVRDGVDRNRSCI